MNWTVAINLFALVVYVAMGLGFGNVKPDPWVPEVGAIIVMVVNVILKYYGDKGTTVLGLKV